jgi:hypothetical protein
VSDVISKVAYDPILAGKHMHVEVAGLLRSFKIFTPASGTSVGTSATAIGGGGSVNFNLEIVKNLHLILDTFYSDGSGRYIFGLGPDLIVKANGRPSLVHSGSGIGGFEWQMNGHNMLYGYYGGAYYRRNTAVIVDPKRGALVCGFWIPGFFFVFQRGHSGGHVRADSDLLEKSEVRRAPVNHSVFLPDA